MQVCQYQNYYSQQEQIIIINDSFQKYFLIKIQNKENLNFAFYDSAKIEQNHHKNCSEFLKYYQPENRTYNIQYLVLEDFMQPIKIFEEFVSSVRMQLNYKQCLLEYQSAHNLKKYKFTEISAENAISMFQQIVDKFYKSHSSGQSGTWFENQLKLYLWTVICYIEINRKSLTSMKNDDWQFFSKIFYVKDSILFQYQAKTLLDDNIKQSKWQDQQDLTLFNIIIKDSKSKWNQISKSLWVVSKMKYLRTSKQCRQRWLNHLDPSKTKIQWNIKQYLTLFQQVQNKGKKWAYIVKSLYDRRSQHSIKNRYNSIIKKQAKLNPQLKQNEICEQILRKIHRIVETGEMSSNDEFLFGNATKVLGFDNQNFEKCTITFNLSKDKQVEQNKKRLQNFRKKIQNFQYKQSSMETKAPRKNSLVIKKQKSTPLKSRQNSQILPTSNLDDEIFYQQSFEVDFLNPPQHHIIAFTDDFKNAIKQYELDV